MRFFNLTFALLLLFSCLVVEGKAQEGAWKNGMFRWRASEPVLEVDSDNLPSSPEHPWLAVKDPSIVRYDEKWHLFCTLRKQKQGDGRIRIGYCSFVQWEDAKDAKWSVLDLTMGYHGAPQVFYFEPQQKWYLVYQAEDQTRDLKYGPCFSTNEDISDAHGWTLPEPFYTVEEGAQAGLDFWVICDDERAHLFFTSLDGKMWRTETKLQDFPSHGWARPKVALRADVFEASHTYRLKGNNAFLTLIEAQNGKRRYFKAFIADALDGEWRPLAASREKPFVSPVNVANQEASFATSYSHGEFLRSGYDQRLEIEPTNLQLLFQGANDSEYQRGGYGDITWRLGILTQVGSRDALR